MFPALSSSDNPSHGVLCVENAAKWKGIFVNALRGVSTMSHTHAYITTCSCCDASSDGFGDVAGDTEFIKKKKLFTFEPYISKTQTPSTNL